jgi:predicted cobalt transporter CbtA
MPRQVAKLDASGAPVLDKDGKPVMVDNSARDIWITATTLITALNLGIIAYAFSTLIVVIGFVFVLIGKVFLKIS